MADMAEERRFGVFTVLLSLSLICMLVGTFGVMVFHYHYGGVSAFVNALLGNKNSVDYSMWNIFSGIYETEHGITFAEVFVSVVLVAFCFVVPLVYVVAMMVLWLVPMAPKTQFHFWMLLQVLSAWGGLDIFVFSLVASAIFSLGITDFVSASIGQSALGPSCAVLDSTLNTKCMLIEVSVKAWIALPIIAVVLWHLCGLYMYRLFIKVREGKLLMPGDHGYLASVMRASLGNSARRRAGSAATLGNSPQ